jgi:3-hydroxy-9,10-secoandrosta-1,3,5(10)-triene-9,17-dione monooxygenase
MPAGQHRILKPNPIHADWLPESEVSTLTVEDVARRLRAAGPVIAAEADATEQQRFPTETAWSAVRKSGMFYLTVPREFGGVGIDRLDAYIEPIFAIAENCMSTAWCAFQSMQHQWMAGLFPEQFRREIFESLPYLTASGSSFPLGRARKVDGGYRVNGRYRWGSGILYAQWVFAIALIEDEGNAPRSACFFMPAQDVTILDTWFVDGMAGTGSHDFVIDDVFVPDHRALDAMVLGLGQQDRANPLERAPLPVVAPAIVPLPIIGAARSVVSAYRDRLTAEGTQLSATGRRGDHVALAKAETAVRIAELTVRDEIAQIQGYLDAARPIPGDVRTVWRAQSTYAVDLCKTAVRALGDLSGSGVHQIGNPMQRAIRDINMLSSHTVIDFPHAMDALGRQMVGLPAETVQRT